MSFEIYTIAFKFDSGHLTRLHWQVLLLVKGALLEDPRLIEDVEEEKKNPMGLMHITALRLADIFSDDSNFRNLVMDQLVRENPTNIFCYSVQLDHVIVVFLINNLSVCLRDDLPSGSETFSGMVGLNLPEHLEFQSTWIYGRNSVDQSFIFAGS